MATGDLIRKELERFRDLILRDEEGPVVAFHRVSDDLARDGEDMLVFTADEKHLLEDLEAALSADPRFEHLKDGGRVELVDFAARVQLRRDGDQVAAFFERNDREPEERTCFFSVEFLAAQEKFDVAGVTLIPMIDTERERLNIGVAPDVRTVAAVPVRGTDLAKMARRARTRADYALRVLRISLREDRMVHGYQLRFRLGSHYSFERGLGAWEMRPDASWELEIDEELLRIARGGPLWTQPPDISSKLDRQVAQAMEWIDQAFLVGDPLLELLFYFFALEALLGDSEGGLKSHRIAFRRAILGRVTREQFAHPNRVALLYDRVRSAAVHGSEPPEVEPRLLAAFASDTRRALVEYLEFARAREVKKRSRLIRALEATPERQRMIVELREDDPKNWKKFLDDLEAA